jgi:hypothetical protein
MKDNYPDKACKYYICLEILFAINIAPCSPDVNNLKCSYYNYCWSNLACASGISFGITSTVTVNQLSHNLETIPTYTTYQTKNTALKPFGSVIKYMYKRMRHFRLNSTTS